MWYEFVFPGLERSEECWDLVDHVPAEVGQGFWSWGGVDHEDVHPMLPHSWGPTGILSPSFDGLFCESPEEVEVGCAVGAVIICVIAWVYVFFVTISVVSSVAATTCSLRTDRAS